MFGNGKWRGRFIPKEVGEHKVRIEVGSTPLLGSPFTCKVGDATKCKVTANGKGVFVVYVTQCCHAFFNSTERDHSFQENRLSY